MPTSIDEVKGFLDEYGLRSMVDESAGVILIGFGCDPDETTYRDNDGDAHVKVVIEVMEEGGFLRVAAPFAWKLDACIHRAAVLGVLPALQGRYKMLRFDHDPQDGELQPNVELALEDASLATGPRAGACDSRDGEPGGVDRGDDDGEDGEARKAG